MAFVGSSILSQSQGVPLFFDTQTVTTPGSPQSLISFTVSQGVNLSSIIVTCRRSGVVRIKADADIIGSGRTGPSEMNVIFNFTPLRNIGDGVDIVVEFEASSSGNATDIEAYLQAYQL